MRLLLFIVQTMRGRRAHQVVRGALLAVLHGVGFLYWCLRSLRADLGGSHRLAAERLDLLSLVLGTSVQEGTAGSTEVGIAHCWLAVAHRLGCLAGIP